MWKGLWSLRKSRKFWIAVAAVVLDILTNGWTPEVYLRTLTIMGGLAALMTAEDCAEKRAGKTPGGGE